MIFSETGLAGVYIVDMELAIDERGFFARTWSVQECEKRGLSPTVVQCNISYNRRVGTVRGMHFQIAPHEEEKWVRCTAGAIYDVVVDLRTDSPTFRRWEAVELSAANRRTVFVPKGCAHGFQTLTEDSEVYYQISEPYFSALARGVQWDDPAFGITWPIPVSTVSERDRAFPLLGA